MNLKRFVDTPLSKLVTGHVLPLMIVTALWAGCNILKAQSEAGSLLAPGCVPLCNRQDSWLSIYRPSFARWTTLWIVRTWPCT